MRVWLEDAVIVCFYEGRLAENKIKVKQMSASAVLDRK